MFSAPYQSQTLAKGIHGWIGGTGEAIGCLPGWPQTAQAFAEVSGSLAQKHQVIVLDPPGLGESAPSNSGYDTKTISNILGEAVRTKLGQDKQYHLVGHDVGAWIAYAWAAQHASSVLSLTLIDSSIPGAAAPLTYPLPDAVNHKLFPFSFNRLPDLPEILTTGRERQFIDWLFNSKSTHPERLTAAKREHYAACYSKLAP
jgi:microsomal epoxide hydrolase